jgi:hypothetical protein
MDTLKSPPAAPWPELLDRYERVLGAAEDFEEPALLAAERELRERLRRTPQREQAGVAAAVRAIDRWVLGWTSDADTARELKSLGFSELAIAESRRLQ